MILRKLNEPRCILYIWFRIINDISQMKKQLRLKFWKISKLKFRIDMFKSKSNIYTDSVILQ